MNDAINAGIEAALASPQAMDAYLEVRSAQEVINDIRALRPEPSAADALSPATEVRRDFWLHYDHQTGRWCVEERPPKVIRTGAEVIHTREVSAAAILALPCADEAAIRADERETPHGL